MITSCKTLLLPLLLVAPPPQDPPAVELRSAPASKTRTLRAYDIRDLVEPFFESEMAEKDAERRARGVAEAMSLPPMRAETAATSRKQNARALEEMIELFIEPSLSENDHCDLTDLNGDRPPFLVVSATEAHHRWVDNFLTTQRRNERSVVQVEHQFFFLDDESLKSLELKPGSWLISESSATEAENQAVRASQRILSGEAGDLLSAPKVLALNRQRFTISVINQHSYVKYYKVHERVEPENIRVVDPVIDVIQEGLTAEGRAVVLGDGTTGLHLEVTLSELERPMRQEKTELGVIGVPVVKTTGLETQIVLAKGDSFFYVGPRSADGKFFGAIVRAQVVPIAQVAPSSSSPTIRLEGAEGSEGKGRAK